MLHELSPTHRRRIAMMHKLNEQSMSNAHTRSWHQHGYRLIARIGSIEAGDRYMSFKLHLRNVGDIAFPLARVEIRDHSLTHDFLDILVAATDSNQLPSTLQPGAEFDVVISAEGAKRLRQDWALMLVPSNELPAARFRFKDAPSLPRPYKRLAVGVAVQAGAAQFSRGEARDVAMARSVSLRARYGVFKHFGVEGAISYFSSGQAMFDEGGQLDVTGVRTLFSGVLTFGDKYAPFIRAGVGVMGVSIDDGISDRFSFVASSTFGVGVDIWFSKRLLTGAVFDFHVENDDDVPSEINLGAHVSYAWDFWTVGDQ